MAIQFPCPGCSQPIEVDHEHAGQSAACPYCRRVVTVPSETTYQAGPVTARPAGGSSSQVAPLADGSEQGPGPPGEGLHVGPVPRSRRMSARSYGNYALICASLALLCLATTVAIALSVMAQSGGFDPSQPLTPAEMSEMMQDSSAGPWNAALSLGVALFSIVGLALAVASLNQSRRENWRGFVAVFICGGLCLCFCGGILVTILGFAG
jgi:hypothetical protein